MPQRTEEENKKRKMKNILWNALACICMLVGMIFLLHAYELTDNRLFLGAVLIIFLVLVFVMIFILQRDAERMLERHRSMSAENKILRMEINEMHEVHRLLHSGGWKVAFAEDGSEMEVYWSDDLREMLGYQTREEFPDGIVSWKNLLEEEEEKRVSMAFWSAAENRKGSRAFDMEYHIRTKDGSLKLVHATGVFHRREDGTPIVFHGLMVDMDRWESKKGE